MKASSSTGDRRRHLRSASHTTAVIRHGTTVARYEVRNLSQSGALLTGGKRLPVDLDVDVILQVSGLAPIRVKARVVHTVDTLDGSLGSGITFLPETPLCAEHIEAALAAELQQHSWRLPDGSLPNTLRGDSHDPS